MAESERGNKTPTSQRRPYQQNKQSYPSRGRGRPDPHVSKALHYFGVPDLREWLDKKHEGEGQPKGSGPPPDPSYNYLKDPLRENANYDLEHRHHKENPEHAAVFWSKSQAPRGSRGRGGRISRGGRRSETENTSFIQNPINIKVELSTATGERSYKLDEGTKLADIKHVPDHKQERKSFKSDRGKSDDETKHFPDRQRQERRSFKDERSKIDDVSRADVKHFPDRQQHERRSLRGERGRIEESDKGFRDWQHERQPTRGRNAYERGSGRGARHEGGRGTGESWRGRGGRERGRGDRGRGGRGTGQGSRQERYNKDKRFDKDLPQNIHIATEVPMEEDWDDECVDSPPTPNDQNDNVEKQVREDTSENKNVEQTYVEDQKYYEEKEQEDYEEETDEYLEAVEAGYDDAPLTLNDGSCLMPDSDIVIKVEENLVITSSVLDKDEETGKRTVRFEIKDDKDANMDGVKKGAQQEIEGTDLVCVSDEKTKDVSIPASKTVKERDLVNQINHRTLVTKKVMVA